MPMQQLLIESHFQLDGLKGEYAGYHNPSTRWNGFAIPYFTKEDAIKVLEGMSTRDSFSYESTEAGDFIVYDDLCNDDESYTPFDLEINNQTTKMYSIGGYMWCWSAEGDFDS